MNFQNISLWGIVISVSCYYLFVFQYNQTPYDEEIIIENVQQQDVFECVVNHLTRQKLREIIHENATGFEIISGTPQTGMKMINHYSEIQVQIESDVNSKDFIVKYHSQALFNQVKVSYQAKKLKDNKVLLVKNIQNIQPIIFYILNYYKMQKMHRELIEQVKQLLENDPKFCYVQDQKQEQEYFESQNNGGLQVDSISQIHNNIQKKMEEYNKEQNSFEQKNVKQQFEINEQQIQDEDMELEEELIQQYEEQIQQIKKKLNIFEKQQLLQKQLYKNHTFTNSTDNLN